MIGKVILGLVAAAGGGLTLWRGTQEYAEFKTMGPPAWWVLWMHPIKSPKPPTKKPPTSRSEATRVFRWVKDHWAPLTKHIVEVHPPSRTSLRSGPPTGRSVYAEVTWRSNQNSTGWLLSSVQYARDVEI